MSTETTRRAVVARIKQILEQVEYSGTTRFEAVFVGEPMGLPIQTPHGAIAAFWFTGEAEVKARTMGNVMVRHRWRVRMYWRLQPTVADREAIEIQMYDACRSVQAAILADAHLTLDGVETGNDVMEIGLASALYQDITDPSTGEVTGRYRVLEFDMDIEDLNEEAISG